MSDIKDLKNEFEKYLDKIIENYNMFKEGMFLYIDNGLSTNCDEAFEKIHFIEEDADRLRRSIVKKLLKGSFLSNTREEFLKLIDMCDEVPGTAVAVTTDILVKEINNVINKDLLKNIISITETQISILKRAVLAVFKSFDNAVEETKLLEVHEKEVDTLENIIKKDVRNSNLNIGEKLYYNNFIDGICEISDIVEDIGDEIVKIAIIRKG